ncbi:hypothetical protein HHI36_008515 [Cryptolaemus montrouzieri]|uniref:Uncharacterized protein n=1 Tax=Cryptolaemus montrouzieri TaxID=559131 RepID=A0ABD2MSP6_9CUCU
MMYLIVSWEWKELTFRRTIENLPDATKPYADDIAIVQMGIVSQQGSDTELKSIAGRIVFVFSLICFMFMYTAYSGMIVALLQSTANMITTLDDLLTSGIELGIEDLVYAIPYFKVSSMIYFIIPALSRKNIIWMSNYPYSSEITN